MINLFPLEKIVIEEVEKRGGSLGPRIYAAQIYKEAELEAVLRGYSVEDSRRNWLGHPVLKDKRLGEAQQWVISRTVPSFIRRGDYQRFRIRYTTIYCIPQEDKSEDEDENIKKCNESNANEAVRRKVICTEDIEIFDRTNNLIILYRTGCDIGSDYKRYNRETELVLNKGAIRVRFGEEKYKEKIKAWKTAGLPYQGERDPTLIEGIIKVEINPRDRHRKIIREIVNLLS